MYHLNICGITVPYDENLLTESDKKMKRVTLDGHTPNIPNTWLAIWKSCFQPGDVVVDIGAFIGTISIHLAILGGVVHAFEGSPRNYYRLKEICRPLRQIKVHPVAISSQSKKCRTRFNDCIRGDGDQHPEQDVEYVVYDEYAKDINARFIKMDIEGMESVALLGMRNTLEVIRPIWQLEYHEALHLPKYSDYPGFVDKSNGGFDFNEFDRLDYTVMDGNLCPAKLTSYQNYFIVPNERLREVIRLFSINVKKACML
jgi:FkbM family methyltransferase